MLKYDRGSVRSSGTFTGQTFDVDSFIRNAEGMQGTFNGEVKWCNDLESGDWIKYSIRITDHGTLECRSESPSLEKSSSQTSEVSLKKPSIDHLQSCKVKLIEKSGNTVPIIEVTTQSHREFFLVNDSVSFESLLSSLIWWSALKTKGVFNKITLKSTPAILGADDVPTNLLVSQLVVYGPLPHRRIPVIRHISRPSFVPKSKTEEGWFPVMGVLKSDGKLDFLLQSDGKLVYSLDIRALLRSEIRMLDRSLQNDNMLFLGTIHSLRQELGVCDKQKFIVGGPTVKNDTSIILRFPLSIDVEDWLVALKSFAQAEYLSLTGAHDSNRLRLSNRFKISIVEGDFPGIRDASYADLPRLYVELSIWDHSWGRTAVVQGSETPFWREEFVFDENIKICNLRIEIKQRSQTKKDDETVGYVEITQEMINDVSLNKETRLPVLDSKNRRFQIGTICIRIVSSLNFILPAANYQRFESALSEVDLSQIVNSVRSFSLGSDLTFEDIAGILLDVFQVLHKEDDWFSALIDRELVDLDGSITRNTLNNRTSTHIYGTLFRGNSILTRSMESFFYRVGKEYLDLSIGPVLRAVIKCTGSCEVDPARIREDDPAKKEAILEENRERLLQMVENIWMAIYSTSNDIPMPIKNQMRTLRKKLELICIEDDVTRVLNCVSGMLFLRFFCPVILNPKLFDLVRSHLNEQSRRTVTLISKVLLNLSNLSSFGNKEPYMKGLNCFIENHKGELLDYIDKVTQKKLDFAPKKLRLTSSVLRPKLLMDEEILAELPTNPYLIDRYLRETELFTAFATCVIDREKNGKMSHSLSLGQVSKSVANLEISVDHRRSEIGELEFEKISENNAEVFGNDLFKYLKQDKETSPTSNLKPNIEFKPEMMEQLERESTLLFYRTEHLKRLFADYEFPAKGTAERRSYSQFLAKNTYCSKTREILIDPNHQMIESEGITKLFSTHDTQGLLDSIVPRVSTQSSRSGSPSASDNPTTVGRTLSKFKVSRANKPGSHPTTHTTDENDTLHSAGSSIKRWWFRGPRY